MTRTTLVYRGVRYDASHHDLPDTQPVEHIYRGVHYREPLCHPVQEVDEAIELRYRGHTYHHRRRDAARQVNAG